MVFLVRNHLFLEKKMVFRRAAAQKTIFFSRKRWFFRRMVAQNHLFLEKKMVSNQKNHLFLEKTKKNKKNIFWRPQPHSFGKDVFFWFFWFSPEKDGFFGSKPSFLEKKMVFRMRLLKNHLFLEKKMVFRRMVAQNHLFLEKKMVSNQKNHLFLEKTKKNKKIKKQKKTSFYLGPPKDGFFEQPPFEKTIFFSRKRWFFRFKKTIFFSRKPKKTICLEAPAP